MFGLTPFRRNTGISVQNSLDDFHNMIDDFFNSDSFFPTFSTDSFRMDIKQTEQEYIVEAELPGMQKENIKIQTQQNQLMISAASREEKEDEKESYLHRERRASTVQRSIYLPNMNREGIQAKFENGILRIHIPKLENRVDGSEIEIQ